MRERLSPVFLIISVVLALCATSVSEVPADTVYIDKVRILQQSESTYVLEADIISSFRWAIKQPVFPNRFSVSELVYNPQPGGTIIVQATATSSGEPLTSKDEILLPWARNGSAVSLQLLDGSIHQGLFLRSLEGIKIPLHLLIPEEKDTSSLVEEHILVALAYIIEHVPLLILTFLLGLMLSAGMLISLYGGVGAGVAISLILFELGVLGTDFVFVHILFLIVTLILSATIYRGGPIQGFTLPAALCGVAVGVSYGLAVSSLQYSKIQQLQAIFSFSFTILIICGLASVAGAVLRPFLKQFEWAAKIPAVLSGSLAVALLITCFTGPIPAGTNIEFDFGDSRLASRYELPVMDNANKATRRPSGARSLKTPVMGYLSIEPYEIRQEILINARTAVQLLGVDDTGMGAVPLESLEPLKQAILSLISKGNSMVVDGSPALPVLSNVDFVTLSSAGVLVRTEPEVESLDDGILGITLVYDTKKLADTIALNWNLFTSYDQEFEFATSDPFGGSIVVITPEDNTLEWRSRISGYQPQPIETVTITKQQIPIFSIILALAALALFVWRLSAKQQGEVLPVYRKGFVCIVVLAVVFYPFYRVSASLPFISSITMSENQAEDIAADLLQNVYRAFDVRAEGVVYDRLALSVTGDKLTEIYLQNRQSLAFENRGGARARVEEVAIKSVGNIERLDGGGFTADITWLVSGSVSHFGHTHYRRNLNNALVFFVRVDNVWKIKDIEIIEETRLI